MKLRFVASAAVLALGAAFLVYGTSTPRESSAAVISASNPCAGTPAPAAWHHIVVVMFENTSQDSSGHVSGAPFVNGLVDKCGTSRKWNDANYKVDGTKDGSYNSKPSYAVLTNGLPATVTGIKDDTYATKTGVDNIFNQLRVAGRDGSSFVEGRASGDVCSGGGSSSGSYHDPMRYYTDLPNAWCNAHDLDLSKFDPAHLPDLSFVIPKNTSNWHDNSVASGDAWLQTFLTPLLNSPQYASGDTAVFFLTDEESPVVNALIAPSITPGSTVTASGNPVSHYAGLRTFEEMLGLPVLADAQKAPSLLPFFGGTGNPTTTTTQPTTTSTAPPTSTSTTNPPTTTTTVPQTGCIDQGAVYGPATWFHVVYDQCITGGTVWGTNPFTDPWSTFHSTGGWVVRGDAKISGTTAVNVGDSYHYETGSLALYNVRGLYGHDDCIENDRHLSGYVVASTCASYVSYSDAGEFTNDGSGNRVSLAFNRFELLPIPSPYKGPSPGSGPFFKTDANSATVNLAFNTLIAHQVPNHGTLGPPAHVGDCFGNVIFWTGTGPFPAKDAWRAACPDTQFVESAL